MWGNEGRDSLYGGDGDDDMDGGGDDDLLKGGDGRDTLWGGKGNDTLDGGDGDDFLWGNNGNDTFIFSGNSGKDVIRDYDADSDTIQIKGVSGIEDSGDLYRFSTKLGNDDAVIIYKATEVNEDNDGKDARDNATWEIKLLDTQLSDVDLSDFDIIA